MEVEGTVFRLEDDVVIELPIEVLEFRNSLFYTIFTFVSSTIDERTPHDDATVGLHGISQHVSTVCMGTLVVEGTGLTLGVGFHQETTEVRNLSVYLLGLSLPPRLYLLVQRVSRLQWLTTVDTLGRNRHRRTKVDGEIDLDAVRSQNGSDLLHLINIGSREHHR